MPKWTEYDLNVYEARRKASNERLEVLEGCEDEAELQQQILDECRRRGWMTFHGSMAHRTFRVPGEPDLIICQDGGKVLMVECKTRTGKLSTDQQAIHAWAARINHTIHTVRSFDQFLNLITTTKP